MLELLRKYILAPIIVQLLVPFVVFFCLLILGIIFGSFMYPLWWVGKFWNWLNKSEEKMGNLSDLYLEIADEKPENNYLKDWRIFLGFRLSRFVLAIFTLVIIL